MVDVETISAVAPEDGSLTLAQVEEVLERFVDGCSGFEGRRVLLIVPDNTRTAPVGTLFKGLEEKIGKRVQILDVLVALGTHPPMSEEDICKRLEITVEERRERYGKIRFFNHEWSNKEALETLGTIPETEVRQLSGGLFSMELIVEVNKRILEYDDLVVIGPVFPHEVVGFSGGNKYFFPGVSGPDILNFFHWLGAVVTNPMIIGNKWTPVRKVVDRAAQMIPKSKYCLAAVVDSKHFYGLFAGTPEGAWDCASELSARVHITYKSRSFHTVLSCAPPMYDELWVAGKCMYKLEPVVADGGELIIYAPELREISLTHGRLIEEVGYHCRDYFLKQWDRFKDFPWGILAHSTHVYGIGTYENGVETPRVRVTLATGIPPEICRKINLGYRDPAEIDPKTFADREEEGVLFVPKAGEELFHLKDRPRWAGGQ